MAWGQGWRDAQENTCYSVEDPGLISNTYMVAQNCNSILEDPGTPVVCVHVCTYRQAKHA